MNTRKNEMRTVQADIKAKQAEINELKPTLDKKAAELTELIKLANYLSIAPRVEYAREAEKHLFLIDGVTLYKVFSIKHEEKDGKEVRTLVHLRIDKRGRVILHFDNYFFNVSYATRGVLANQTEKRAIKPWGKMKSQLKITKDIIQRHFQPKYQHDLQFRETLETALALHLQDEIEQHVAYVQRQSV